jgi:effector-binding domain-containing protein
LREVGALVAITDSDARAAIIAQHLQRLETQLDETRAAVVSLHRLLHPAPTPLEVLLRRSEATTVAAVRGVVDLRDALTWYSGAMGELEAALSSGNAARIGPPGGLYDNELFTEERGMMVVYVPVDAPPTLGRVEPFVIPAIDMATTMHIGSHDDIDLTYAALGAYVSQQALGVAGPVREIYHVGLRDTDDSSAWRTEIGWPIFRTAGGGLEDD